MVFSVYWSVTVKVDLSNTVKSWLTLAGNEDDVLIEVGTLVKTALLLCDVDIAVGQVDVATFGESTLILVDVGTLLCCVVRSSTDSDGASLKPTSLRTSPADSVTGISVVDVGSGSVDLSTATESPSSVWVSVVAGAVSVCISVIIFSYTTRLRRAMRPIK